MRRIAGSIGAAQSRCQTDVRKWEREWERGRPAVAVGDGRAEGGAVHRKSALSDAHKPCPLGVPHDGFRWLPEYVSSSFRLSCTRCVYALFLWLLFSSSPLFVVPSLIHS